MSNGAEIIARHFHEAYERLAPALNYETREASRKDWSQIPPENRRLMIAVVAELLDRGIIIAGVEHGKAVR